MIKPKAVGLGVEPETRKNIEIDVLGDFAALKSSAPEAWSPDEQVDFFLTAEWFELLARCGVAPHQRLWLPVFPATATRGSGCLPLMVDTAAKPSGSWRSVKAGITGLSNFYTSLFGAVRMRDDGSGFSDEELVALAREVRQLPSSAVITLQPLALEHEFFLQMKNALRRSGFWTDQFFCFGNWYLPCEGLSFDSYLTTRSSQLRNNVARGRRRLSKAGAWEIEICAGNGASLPRMQAEFEAVYAASWKQSEAHPAFITGLIQLAAHQGWLRLGVLRLNDEAIAAQLWIVKGRRRASIYKLAYREGYAKFSAGSILTAALMERVLDTDKVAEVDYLTGDDDYKRDWMSHRRERWGLIAFDPQTLQGLSAAARHYGGVALRSLKQSLLKRLPRNAV